MVITKELLEEYHINQKLNVKEIAQKLNKAPSTIHRWMGIFEIKNITPPNRIKKYKYDEHFFEKIDNEEKAYWLGFIMADGYVATIKGENKKNIKQKKLRIVLKREDRSQLVNFKKAIKGNMPIVDFIQHKFGKKYKASRIDVNCTKMCNDLAKWGIVGNKSNKEKMPRILKKWKMHFIRGLFDGDGSFVVSEEGKWIWGKYSQAGSKSILLSIKGLFEEKGIEFPNSYIIDLKGIHVLHCSKTKNVIQLMDTMYKKSTVYMKRKKEKYDTFRSQKI